jgi:hypothetical protein
MEIKIVAHLSLSSIQQLNPLMNWKQFFKKFVCMSKQGEGREQERARTLGVGLFLVHLHQSEAT